MNNRFFVITSIPFPGNPPEIGDVVQLSGAFLMAMDGTRLGKLEPDISKHAVPARDLMWEKTNDGTQTTFIAQKKFLLTHKPIL